jgi:hypothetical protein
MALIDLAELRIGSDKMLAGKFDPKAVMFGGFKAAATIRVEGADKGGNDRAPDYRVMADDAELGALWKPRNRGGKAYATGKADPWLAKFLAMPGEPRLLLFEPRENGDPWRLVIGTDDAPATTEGPEGNSNGDFGTRENSFAGQETL